MYEAHWGLQERPFENTPDPRFYYASSQHQEACARLLYCIRERKGAAVLTGVFGCGKTVVSHVILQELNQERYRTAVITNPRLTDVDFLRKIAYHLGVEDPSTDKVDVLIRLEQLMTDHAKEGRDTVVVVDEAHAIHDPGVFEELRLLLNFQWRERFLITLLLLGQPELRAIIDNNKPLEQRIGLKAHLDPLSAEETREYIQSRLRVAGHPNPDAVFSAEAIRVIFESTGGIPRRINRLCDISLLAGMGLGLQTIEAAMVMDEVKGLAV